MINTDTLKLKAPHFIKDHKVKDVEKSVPSVASYGVYPGKSRSGRSRLIIS